LTVRVARVEAVPYALAFRAPYATARGTLERREMVLLRLRTDDGPEGLGEAVPLTLRGGAGAGEIRAQIESAAERLEGLELAGEGAAPLDVAIATMLELARPRRLAAPTLAALESALFDLAAKLAGRPLWELLGAERVAPIRCNATLTAGEPEAVASEARTWAADGYQTFKLKLGAGFDDVATVREVRDAVGPDARLRVDVNQAWDVREAIARLDDLEGFGLELCEQPVEGLRAMARVARDVAVPLAGDEAVTSEADAHRAVQRRACRYATAKLSKVGGIGAAASISRVLPTYLSSALEGPVGIAAAGHCAQVIEQIDLAHGLATQRLFAESIATRECELRNGLLHLPSGPGLGVDLDEASLERHRI
jgi:L-alanine-DL-glutamate epimerase-like enolase superfamily enzyme